ncbi:MAG: maleylpyruvate isomerase family mycothiol-dependent enzyme [Actinomycetota bacterium]|nr:maleylpyruvate isomerase family mycothiol-dependent enzyme [Actinomycetota bacterium]
MTLSPATQDPFTVPGDPVPTVVYRHLRESFSARVSSLDQSQLATMVPQCPEWTVADVLAHVVGINADFLAGRLVGIGSDDWTAAQVRERAGRSIAVVLAEWLDLAEQVDRVTADDPFTGVRLTADLVTHHLDVLAALGRRQDTDTAAVRTGLLRYGPFFCERARDAGLPTVRIVAGHQRWQSHDGHPSVVLTGSAFELLRAFSGRRSAAQVRAMDWSGDPEPYLAVVTPYGLPEVDVEG